MRIYCKVCKGKGKIDTPRRLTDEFSKLYCSCLDPECGHRWVSHLEFSHSLNEPVRTLDTLLLDHFRDMPAAEQAQLLAQLSKQPSA